MKRAFDWKPNPAKIVKEPDGLLRALSTLSIKPRSMRWDCQLYLDQYDEGACTGFAFTHFMATAPYPRPLDQITSPHARWIYRRGKELDAWPGEDYEGTSTFGASNAAIEQKWLTSVKWLSNEAELCKHLGYVGPAVLGTRWYEGMMDVLDGFVKIEGESLGGHCYLINEYSVEKQAYNIHNSWGINWGVFGNAWIKQSDLARLINDGGEVCAPIKALIE